MTGSEPAPPLPPSPPGYPNRIDHSDAGTEEGMSLRELPEVAQLSKILLLHRLRSEQPFWLKPQRVALGV